VSSVAGTGVTTGRAAGGRATALALARAAKPRIVALFALTVLAATVLAGPASPARTLAIVGAAALTVAGAAALNGCLERDLDARMSRTSRRPVAAGAVSPALGLVFGCALTGAGIAAVWLCGGALAAAFAAAGAAWYVVVYTLLIKPRTALSSVPGGLAGVFPLLIGWTAAGGAFDGEIIYLCALVALWSPPHFWALAFALKDDYLASGIPTPAVVHGDAAAARMILAAVAALVALTFVPVAAGLYGAAYLTVVAPAGACLVLLAIRLVGTLSRHTAWSIHKLSGPYLAAVLAAMMIGRLV